MKNKKILIGVTGGIAVYKAIDLISRLKKQGAEVKVIITEHVTQFVTPLTFQTLSENVVYTGMFASLGSIDVEHISLAKWAGLILIAPATASTVVKIDLGLADSMLTTVLLAKRSSVMIAPAVSTYMLGHKTTQDHLKNLEKNGYTILPCDQGVLACGDAGSDELLAPEKISEAIQDHFTVKDLEGVDIVVTTGGTREPIDPVRYIGNRSSGKMGYAIAKATKKGEARVRLIPASSSLPAPEGIGYTPIETTEELYQEASRLFDNYDIYISPAAPAGCRPKERFDQKVKRKDQKGLSIDLISNPDTIRNLSKRKKKQIMVASAAESRNLVEHAKEKLEPKNVGFIVANSIEKKDAGFATDTNIVTIIDKDSAINYTKQTKKDLVEIILNKIVKLSG